MTATPDRPLVLCRPTAVARRMIRITRLDEFASVRADLPRQWPGDDGDATTGTEQRTVGVGMNRRGEPVGGHHGLA